MKNGQYVKISIIKTPGKNSKAARTLQQSENSRIQREQDFSTVKDESFSCVGRFSNQKIHLNCQWKPGLFLAANTNVESLSGEA